MRLLSARNSMCVRCARGLATIPSPSRASEISYHDDSHKNERFHSSRPNRVSDYFRSATSRLRINRRGRNVLFSPTWRILSFARANSETKLAQRRTRVARFACNRKKCAKAKCTQFILSTNKGICCYEHRSRYDSFSICQLG